MVQLILVTFYWLLCNADKSDIDGNIHRGWGKESLWSSFSISVLLCHLGSEICSGLAKPPPCCLSVQFWPTLAVCASLMKSTATIVQLHLTVRSCAPYGMFTTIAINNCMVCFSTASSFMFSHVGRGRSLKKTKHLTTSLHSPMAKQQSMFPPALLEGRVNMFHRDVWSHTEDLPVKARLVNQALTRACSSCPFPVSAQCCRDVSLISFLILQYVFITKVSRAKVDSILEGNMHNRLIILLNVVSDYRHYLLSIV